MGLEGKSLESASAAARSLGVSTGAMRRRLQALHDRGVLRCVTLTNSEALGRRIESTARIRVDWSRREGVARFEAALRADPCVSDAAVVTGAYDYIVYASHPSTAEAIAWMRSMDEHDCITWRRVDRARTCFKRFAFAAALFGPEA
jgi:DNA-binding Lrp family transcriptional regulator